MTSTAQRMGQHVEVRIRTDEYPSDDAIYLCQSSVADLEDLITLLKKWGVQVDGNTYTSLSGQFSIGATDAFFEVIVNTTDAD